jgi:aryl-alcohol dehydrogenase-like predicted oxidoreductase
VSDQVKRYEDFCDELGREPAVVALAWLLHQRAVTGPIIGPRTMDQLDSALDALELQLSDKELLRLDEIWPGHKPAPEDYTW